MEEDPSTDRYADAIDRQLRAIIQSCSSRGITLDDHLNALRLAIKEAESKVRRLRGDLRMFAKHKDTAFLTEQTQKILDRKQDQLHVLQWEEFTTMVLCGHT